MESLALQSTGMRDRGLGWRAERCADPASCDLHLCISDDRGSFWHPADPLAFARWRIRADIDAIPAHVVVPVRRGWVLSGKDHVGSWLRLTLASHSAVALPLPPRSTSRVAEPARRCGFSGVLPG